MKTQAEIYEERRWRFECEREALRNKEHGKKKAQSYIQKNWKPKTSVPSETKPKANHDQPNWHPDTFVYADPNNMWDGNTIPW